jgi:hypothetical protein
MEVACETCGKKTTVQRLDAEDGAIVLRGLDNWSYGVVRRQYEGTHYDAEELFIFACSGPCRLNLWKPLEHA